MAMNRCLINVALALGSCGLLAPLMPGVTAIAQSRRQQPHPGHVDDPRHGQLAEDRHVAPLVGLGQPTDDAAASSLDLRSPVPIALVGDEGGQPIVKGTADPVWTLTNTFKPGNYVPVFGLPQKEVIDFVKGLNDRVVNKLSNCKPQQRQWVKNQDEFIHITIDDEFFNDGCSHDYNDENKLKKMINMKKAWLQDMATQTNSKDLDLTKMTLEYNKLTPAGEILYLKLKFNTTECARLSTSTGHCSKDWHITVGHFNKCDDDKKKCLDEVINDSAINKYVSDPSGVVTSPVRLNILRIVVPDNTNANYYIYTKFKP